jgi:hypothetical protein
MLIDSRIEDFMRVLRQGAFIFAYLAQAKFQNVFEKNKACSYKREEIIMIQAEIENFCLLPKIKHP